MASPSTVISDSGGAYTSDLFDAVCRRLGIHHQTMTGKDGESYKNLIETHFNIQRRLYDYQFSLSRTPIEFEQAHRRFLALYNSTAHYGLLQEQFEPPIPLAVLGEAKGRLYTLEELDRKFSRALFPRTTNRYGCVTLHSYHFYVEEGLPKTRVLLWVYGHALRAVFENVVVAEYYCRYDLREKQVKDIRDGRFYPHDDFTSQQISLTSPQPARILGGLSPEVCATSGSTAFSRPTVVALRIGELGIGWVLIPLDRLNREAHKIVDMHKLLHNVVHHDIVGQKMRAAKRGFAVGKSNRLNSSLA